MEVENTDRRSRSRTRSRSPPPRRARSRSRSRSPASPRSRSPKTRAPFSGGGKRPEEPEPSRCIGVFGLNLRTNEADLQRVFEKYGEIDKVIVVYDQRHNQSRGFGFVYYRDLASAQEAKMATNGMDLDGRTIRVDFSVTKKPHEPTPGYYAGRPTRRSRSPPRRRYRSRSRSPAYRRRYSRSRSPAYRRRSRSRSPYGRR